MTSPAHGWKHQQERKRWEPTVKAGEAWCTEPICLMTDRWIDPDLPWDLAHDRTRSGCYHGPAHSKCNRSEGATFGNRHRGMAVTTTRWVL